MKLGYLTAALILLFVACAETASGQLLSGRLTYVVRNADGKIIDAKDVRLIEPTASLSSPDCLSDTKKEQRSDAQVFGIWPSDSEISTISMMSGCGRALAEIVLEYKGKKMRLKFHNIPGDAPLVDSVPFEDGTFEIDLSPSRYENLPKSQSIALPRERTETKNDKGEMIVFHIFYERPAIPAINWKKTSQSADAK